MKKIFGLLILLIFALSGSALSETFTWTNPTIYIDGSSISAAKQATIKTHLFYQVGTDSTWIEFASVSSGAITYVGVPPLDRGIKANYTLSWELDGVQSAYLTPAISYTRPYIACNPGSNFTIKEVK